MYKSLKKIIFSVTVFTLMILSENVFAQDSNVPVVGKFEKFNPEDYYKPDTDGDGIIDIYDKDPFKYNVTDRDLRFFMKLAYRTQDEIKSIFAGDEAEIDKFNREQLLGAADIREITKNWKFVTQVNESNGFSASFFSIGRQVVLAIRGTDDGSDVIDDVSLFFKALPKQAKSTDGMEEYLKRNYDEYYLTGHSLGGYLAQYLIAKSLYVDFNFKHSALFNAPGVELIRPRYKPISGRSNLILKNLYFSDADKRYPIEEKKSQAFSINGDPVSNVNKMPNIEWFENVSGLSAHKSSNFFATKPNEKFRKWFSTGYRLDNPYLYLDTDGDGIRDIDELRIGTDYKKTDSDGDGFSDKDELISGSDPNNSDETPENVTCTKPPYTNGTQMPTSIVISAFKSNDDNLSTSKNGFIKMESANKPFVITRLSTEERNKITSPVEGMLIWNTTKQCLELYKDFGKGLQWGCVKQGCNK